jgi:hypothetical protein
MEAAKKTPLACNNSVRMDVPELCMPTTKTGARWFIPMVANCE